MFLLGSRVEEESIALDRTTERNPWLNSAEAQTAGWWRIRIGLSGVECFVLDERKGITMKLVLSHSGDDVNCAARCASEFRGQAIVDDLKFAHDLRRERDTRRAGSLVSVIQSIDRD